VAVDGSNRKLVLGLATALMGALLVIAFLLGRETSRSAPATGPAVENAPPPVPDLERETANAERRWPDTKPSDYGYIDVEEKPSARIERRADGTIAISNTQNDDRAEGVSNDWPAPVREPLPDKAGDAVSTYFQQVDLIRSNEGTGDPKSFAMSLIKAGIDGSTSGFDRLIADSARMEQELQRLTPPPSCERYHQASLEALVEGREMLEGMKNAIVARDIEQLKAIAQQAANLQAKAEALSEMQEQIRASARSR